MMSDQSTDVSYRDPYPNLIEKIRWFWIRFFTDREVPPKSWVQLSCPETGRVIATEHTEPVDVDRDVKGGTGVWSYECPECGAVHRWLWGPPAPIRVEDDDTDPSNTESD